MKFIEFLTSKNDKFRELKLKQAVYDSSNGLQLQILFPDKYGTMNEVDKADLLKYAKEYVENQFDVEIVYKKSYVDNEVVWHFVNLFFQKHLKLADTILKKEHLKVVPALAEDVETKQNENFDCFNVLLKTSKSLFETIEEQNIVPKLNKFLQDNICANFAITLDPSLNEFDLQTVLKQNDNHERELSILRDVSIPEEEKFFDFELVDNLIGEIPENYAMRLDQLNTESERNIIAGRLTSFNEKRYPDKRDETKEKVLYSMMVEDHWGKIRCVYFPNQNTFEHIQKLKEGDEIALLGDYESYNGNASFKVNAIGYAKLCEKPEENIKWREPFDEYLVVHPQEYIEMSQLKLLDNEEVEVCEFLQNNDVVVFDFETTGLNVDDAYIIEIGAVKIHNGKLTETFSTLIKPPVKIPQEIVELTHITDEMVANAPTYELVLADFYKFTKGCVLSAYNIDFDAKFLDKFAKSILFKFDNQQIDTLVLARQKLRNMPNYKLKTVVTRLGIDLESAHRALDDAVATAKAFQRLI